MALRYALAAIVTAGFTVLAGSAPSRAAAADSPRAAMNISDSLIFVRGGGGHGGGLGGGLGGGHGGARAAGPGGVAGIRGPAPLPGSRGPAGLPGRRAG